MAIPVCPGGGRAVEAYYPSSSDIKLDRACRVLTAMTIKRQRSMVMIYSGISVIARPGDNWETIRDLWLYKRVLQDRTNAPNHGGRRNGGERQGRAGRA
jgi:hypothetical protein